MNTPPRISLYASAARPQYWMKLYESIKLNKCKFEIVFVGPNAPSESMPDEFRFIKSNTKPVQCAEIAAIESKGEFLLHCVDDLTFREERALDEMLSIYDQREDDSRELVLSPKLMRNRKPFDDNNYKLYPEIRDCPIVPISIFIRRALFLELGGYDINFIASMADTDLTYRAVSEKNASIQLADLYVEENKDDSAGGTLFSDYKNNDLALLKELWFKEKIFLNNRSLPFEGFKSDGILKNTQGTQGRWKVTNDYVAKFITSEFFYSTKNIYLQIKRLLKVMLSKLR